MPKRVCKFNVDLEREFKYIKKTKSDSDVRCDVCNGEFSVSHGGRSDITKHINSDRHKRALESASSSKTINTFFKNENFGGKEAEIAAAEGTMSYHAVCHNHSFRSTDCTSRLVQKIFEPKFTCARTKTEAIVVNVLAPFVDNSTKAELEKTTFLSIYVDASNHRDIKLFPIMVRYFQPSTGVQVKLLELEALPGETSEIITNYLVRVLQNKNISNKVVGFCSDNTNTNFGGSHRKGTKNVYFKLKETLNKDIIGIGCAAHIIHNAIQTAADELPVDVEAVIVKVYTHFYIYTVRVEKFKEFCEEASVQYHKLLGYSKTRWLALMPAVERVLKLFVPLKEYFLTNDKCPRLIKDFFENPAAELWLNFIHCQSAIFHDAVLSAEGQNISAVEVASILADLREKFVERKNSLFLPMSVKSCLKNNEEVLDKTSIVDAIQMFYETSVRYLNEWACHFQPLETLSWFNLRETPAWESVINGVEVLSNTLKSVVIDDNKLFDEVNCLKKYVTNEKVSEWSELKTSVDQRWVEVFLHFEKKNIPYENLRYICELLLCLPGTNAPVERVFTNMNNMWTENKSQLSVKTLRAMLMLKCNVGLSCDKFHDKIKGEPALLKDIHSSKKYVSV